MVRKENTGRERKGPAASDWCQFCGLLQRSGRCPCPGLEGGGEDEGKGNMDQEKTHK